MANTKKTTAATTTPNSIGPTLGWSAREAFKRLRTNVMIALPLEGEQGRVVGVTSAQPSEGKSTVTANLAYALAENGQRVLLIDADVRRPSLHEKLGLSQAPGLSDLLTKSFEVKNILNTYAPENSSVTMDVLTSGELSSNAAELLGSKRMKDLLQAMCKYYDYIVLDLPPVGAVVDAVEISRRCDGMIVVVRDNNCPRAVLKECMDQLTYADANVLGFVMNGVDVTGGRKYSGSSSYGYGSYKKYGYGYGYGYGSESAKADK